MKFKFRPEKKVTDEYQEWFAWFPVKISYNQMAWRETVYRREVYISSNRRRLFQRSYGIEYISKEEYFMRAMKYDAQKEKYEHGEDAMCAGASL